MLSLNNLSRAALLWASILFVFVFVLVAGSSADTGLPGESVLTLAPERVEAISYLYMKEVTSLRQDGDGEEQIEWNIRNDGFSSVSAAGVWIQTPTAAYSNVRTWDETGPIEHTLVVNQGRIEITIHYRYPVLPGSTYRYFLAIDLGDIASYDGAAWHYDWRTGFPVQHFVRGIALPPGATVSAVSPQPDVQSGTYLEWSRYNIAEFLVSLAYDLRPLTDLELAQKFAPYFRLHPNEPYLPMNVDLALQHAIEIKDHSSGDTASNVTTDLLASASWRSKSNAYVDFHGDPLHGADMGGSQTYYIQNVRASVVPTVYARVYRDDPENPTRTIIQYWLYYFYNSWGLVGGLNLHEGDWEMVQVVLDGEGNPLYAAYAQHAPAEMLFYDLKGGSKKEWNDLERDGTHPIVFTGYGSHASYFGPYTYLLGLDDTGDVNAPTVTPLVVLLYPDTDDPWVFFAGRWGEKVVLPHHSGAPSPGGQGTKWVDPLEWAESDSEEVIPWDEESDHHMGKVRSTQHAPCNIGIEERLTGRRFGWFFNTFYSEIDSGEYVVNETSGKRSAIIHDSLFLNHLRYNIVSTCEQSPTPSLPGTISRDPIVTTVQYVDEERQEIVTLFYELPEGWQSPTSEAYVTLSEDSDFSMQIDLDGNGEIDVVEPPVAEETAPLEPPQLSDTSLYLPVLYRE